MDIGRLKHRITFQELSQSQNEYGELVEEWLDIKTVWAEIKPVSGNQFFAAKQINSEISHNVYIRYRTDLKPSMRIKFKERVFDILYLMNMNEDNRIMQIYCKELIG